MPRNFLVSFHPLCSTVYGQRALRDHPHLVPFSDGSCRREPDLQSRYPSITALCRAGLFAPRLQVSDRIFYMTVKGSYLRRAKGWALIAALRVIEKLKCHEDALAWYAERNEPLPSNCIVPGSHHLPLEHTTGLPADGPGMQQAWNQNAAPPATIEHWDAHYIARAKLHRAFVITTPIVPTQLTTPPIFAKDQFKRVFDSGRVPGTQSYKVLSDREFDSLTVLLSGG
ncbi:MAG: hypothetical protein K0S57_84 [Ramlibacter sp.]|jgi:hypothetical protein|nr:hypothetical protein [Ramlibacter sp.]